MDSFNPTTKTQAVLTSALQAATAAGNPEIRPAHLLLALLTQNDGIAAPLLEAVGVEPATVRTEAERILDRLPQASGGCEVAPLTWGNRSSRCCASVRMVAGSTPTASSSGAAIPSFCVSSANNRCAGLISGFPAAEAA